MGKRTYIITKTFIKADAPKQFKYEVTKLLNELMRDYQIKGKDEHFEKAFKDIFKSNLYYIVDNYYNVKTQNAKSQE